MVPKAIGFPDWFEYEDDLWQVVAINRTEATELLIKCARSHRGRHQDQASPAPAELDTSRVLDELTDDERTRIFAIESCLLRALRDAKRYGTTQHERAMILLQEQGLPHGERTTRRYIAAYQREGVAGLVDGRKLAQGHPDRVDSRLVALAEKLMDAETHVFRNTKSRLIQQLQRAAAKQGIPLPTDRTLYRLLDELDRTRFTFGAEHGACW